MCFKGAVHYRLSIATYYTGVFWPLHNLTSRYPMTFVSQTPFGIMMDIFNKLNGYM